MPKHSEGRHHPDALVAPGRVQHDLLQEPFSHYSFVGSLAEALQKNDRVSVVQQLDAIALSDPRRVAICLADVYQYRLPMENLDPVFGAGAESEPLKREVATSMQGVLQSLASPQRVLQELQTLPTVDAYRFRREVLQEAASSCALLLTAAVQRITGRTGVPEVLANESLPNYQQQIELKQWSGDGRFLKEVERSAKYFGHLAHPGSLSPRHQALLEEFNSAVVRGDFFAIERYGYEPVRKELSRMKKLEIGGVALVATPWSESLDLPAATHHQCQDAALTARSFFSARGIPAEIWVGSVADTQHAVAVVYFPEEPVWKPTVVDVSPYGGTYAVRPEGGGGEQLELLCPSGIMTLRRCRANPQPIVKGSNLFRYGVPVKNGVLPWFCQDLPDKAGRILGYAGVLAEQVKDRHSLGQFSSYFSGRGVREPKIILELTLFPGLESEFVRRSGQPGGAIAVTNKKSGKLEILQANDNLSEQQVKALLQIATERFPRVAKTIERLDIDLRKRDFSNL